MRTPFQPSSKTSQVQVPYIPDKDLVQVKEIPVAIFIRPILLTSQLSLHCDVLTGTTFGQWNDYKHI